MSETLLINLRDYLCGTLSPENMAWLSVELAEQSKKKVQKPYTIDELLERAERGRQQIAKGQYKSNDEVFRGLLNKKELKLEAV